MTTTRRRRLGFAGPASARVLPPARLEAFSDGVFAIAITLLVIELHVPTSKEALAAGLEHEWPRYLGYLVSFAFIGSVWIAHSNLTRFIRVVDAPLMRLNMLLLLFVSLLPFTTGVVANHLFASYLAVSEDISRSFGAERIAVVLFGVDMTLAALMLYLLIRHAARSPGIAVDDVAEEELQHFTTERRAAVQAQGCATVVGVFVPVLAVLFYLSGVGAVHGRAVDRDSAAKSQVWRRLIESGRDRPAQPPPERPPGRWQRLVANARARHRGSVLDEFVARMRDENFANEIIIFGALFLLSALPLVILLNSFANRRTQDDLTRHLGLNARARHVVDGLFSSGHVVFSAVVLALIFAVGGTISVAGAVQRIYERTFHQPHLRRWNLPRLLIWAAVLLAWLATDGAISAGTRKITDGIVLDGAAIFSVTTLFFGWSMYFLLAGRVRRRALVTPALLTAAFWIGLEAFSAAYFSSTITADSTVYGSIGVVFSLLTWFTAIAAVVILGAVTGDIAQRRLSSWWSRRHM